VITPVTSKPPPLMVAIPATVIGLLNVPTPVTLTPLADT
jgi:hypothetical protein